MCNLQLNFIYDYHMSWSYFLTILVKNYQLELQFIYCIIKLSNYFYFLIVQLSISTFAMIKRLGFFYYSFEILQPNNNLYIFALMNSNLKLYFSKFDF